MSSDNISVDRISPTKTTLDDNINKKDTDSNIPSSDNKIELIEETPGSESLTENNEEPYDEKQTSKSKVAKTSVKKGHGPGTLSPLSKKLRRDSLRSQLKRACTLALEEQSKPSANIKTRERRHSTGTSKETITKNPVIKKKLRRTLCNTNLKRRRENSSDQTKTEETKTADEAENVKDPKLRRKSNESSIGETNKFELTLKQEKEQDSSIKTVDDIKPDLNVTTSPVRARRSTRLSPETIPKLIAGTKKRGRPAKSTNLDSNIQDKPQTEPHANIDNIKISESKTIKLEESEIDREEKTQPVTSATDIEETSIKMEDTKSSISEIKVHQFYSKPEFFENNLGIENDIELPSIVKIENESTLMNAISESNNDKEEYSLNKQDCNLELLRNVDKNQEVPEDTSINDSILLEEISKSDIQSTREEDFGENNENNSPSKCQIGESDIPSDFHLKGANENSSVEEKEEVIKTSPNSEVKEIEKQFDVDCDMLNLGITEESPDIQKEKENHLKNLGLLTLQAAKDEKRRNDEKKSEYIEEIYDSSSNSKFENEYTGTLKTVIKLNKPTNMLLNSNENDSSKKKTQSNNIVHARQSLKMTFQKGKVRNTNIDKKSQLSDEDYYTIQNESENNGCPQNRKGRSNLDDKCYEPTIDKSDEKKEILIPEKASSFAIHPGRLCQDQCFYCGGKFGLYDTPCHVAQIKSTDRQEKILKNEEKLTVDNCLCDACFRHVDRRANIPAYKKRLNDYLNPSPSTSSTPKTSIITENAIKKSIECFVPDCNEKAVHSLQKKIVKKRLKKCLPPDIILTGTYVQICQTHYDIVMQHIICNLCKRRLNKSHMFPIVNNLDNIYERLKAQEINLDIRKQLLVCKQCKYYINLIDLDDYEYAAGSEFCMNYKKRLLKIYSKTPSQSISKVVPLDMDTSSEETNRNDSHSSEVKTVEVSDSYVVPSDSDSDTSASNKEGDISTVLRSNPNLSMRELFPGEEDLGIQFKAPFNTSFNEKTPEGWTRVQSFLQYDEPTRKLWEELQKPYGNPSSFLRHLIILEKFYRNGDLILSPKASNSSENYNTCVQNRLKSYDNFSPNKNIAQFDEKVHKIQKHLSNNSVTMIPKPKDNLKTMQVIQSSNNSNKKKRNNNKEIENLSDVNLFSTKTNTSELPPELISISKTTADAASQKTKLISMKSNPSQIANVIKLPETLTPQERLSSKNWRPTLIPLTSTTHLNQQGPLYLTADGRRLPALVQVQSSGRPFLISIHDYNRMCILRREKLMRDQMLKSTNKNALNGILNTQIGYQSNKKQVSGNYKLPPATTTSYLNLSSTSSTIDSTGSGVIPTTSTVSAVSTNSVFNKKSGGNGGNNVNSNLLLKDREFLSKIPKNLTVIPQVKSHSYSNASLTVFPQNNPLTISLKAANANIKHPNYSQDKQSGK